MKQKQLEQTCIVSEICTPDFVILCTWIWKDWVLMYKLFWCTNRFCHCLCVRNILIHSMQILHKQYTECCYFPTNFQVLAYSWMVWISPTTALWTTQILELVLQLWTALLPIHTAVLLQTLKLSGTFPMELKSHTIQPYHTEELEDRILEEWFSAATLRVPQQEFSTVTYLMPVISHRAYM